MRSDRRSGGDRDHQAFRTRRDRTFRAAAGLAVSLYARQASESNVKETLMPYNTVADLPKAQTDQYNSHQKQAFLKAFNNAYKEYSGDESRAFAVAHSAAKKAGEKPGPG
jgi:cation transport regulator